MANAVNLNPEQLSSALGAGMTAALKQAGEEYIQREVRNFEEHLRGELAKIVMTLAKDYTFHDRGDHLAIHVKTSGLHINPPPAR